MVCSGTGAICRRKVRGSEKFEEAKLKVKEKRNSAERTRESSRMRALDTYRVEAVNLDKLIVYLGPAIQETIRVSSSKAKVRGC